MRQALRPGVGGGRDGSVRVTFEDKPLLSDIVFLRAWVAVELPRLYNPLTDLLAPAPAPRSGPQRSTGPPVSLHHSLDPTLEQGWALQPVLKALCDHAALHIMQSWCDIGVVCASHLYLSVSNYMR